MEIFILREAEVASAAIAPAWGNNCFMLQVHEPVLESVAFEEFHASEQLRHPDPVSFPNRLRDGAFLFRGQRYVVNPNRHCPRQSMACAQYRRIRRGRCLDHSRFEAVQYAAAILQQFPFPFCLDVTYRLWESVLSMETVVHNTGCTRCL